MKNRVTALFLCLMLFVGITVPVYATEAMLTTSITAQELGEGSTAILTVHLNSSDFVVKSIGIKIVYDSDDVLIENVESLIENTSVSWYDEENHNYVAMLSSEGKYDSDVLRLTINIKTSSKKSSGITLIPSLKHDKTTISCTQSSVVLALTGHTPSETIIENYYAASCVSDGGYDEVIYCSVCSKELSREHHTIAAPGHDYDEGTITKEPTCTEKGVKTFICKHDKSHKYTEDIRAFDHKYNSVVTPPTCTEQGYTTYTCERCKDSYVSDYSNALGHDYESKVTKEPTCTEKGIRTYTCKRNHNHTYTEEISALGHNYKSTVVDSTCTDDGYTTYKCERCNDTYLSDYKDASGHDFESSITKEPTCIEKGVRTYTCKHDHAHTYTEDIPSLGHDYKAVVTSPTCEERGYTTYTCERCKDSYVADYVNALDHDYKSEVTKKPTCTEKGIRTYTCENDKTHTYTEDIPALGHDYKSVVTPPTCTEQGYTTYNCERCKDSYVADYVNALDHDYESKVTKEPTCTEKGVRTYTCKHNSNHTYTEDISALGHDYNSVVTPPTCTEQGYTTYTCERCSNSYKAGYTSPIGHKYDSGTITKKATCTEAGVKTFTCLNDHSHTYKETISALGHDYDEGKITKEPTYTETGIKTYTCKHDSTHTYTEVIPKLTSAPVPSDNEADKAPVNKKIKKPSDIKTVCNTKNKQMQISFNTVSGAVNYRIAYRKAGAKKWSLNWTNGKTTYTLKNLKSKGLYEFKFVVFKLKGGKWERGDWSKVSYRYFFKLTQNKPNSAKKAIKVSWQKDKSAKGYYIFYSTKKSMSGQKKITVKGKNTTSYTIKKLTKGKTYYIRVRAYKVKNGKTYTGEISALKSAKSK